LREGFFIEPLGGRRRVTTATHGYRVATDSRITRAVERIEKLDKCRVEVVGNLYFSLVATWFALSGSDSMWREIEIRLDSQ